MPEHVHAWSRAGRTPLGAVGALAVAGTLFWAAGPLGLAAGIIIAITWDWLPGVYAVALGHLLLLAVLPSPTIDALVALEAGFVAVLLAPLGPEDGLATGLGCTAAGALVLGTIAWVGWDAWEPRWLAALAIVAITAVALYGLHRYTVVLLNLEGGEQPA